MNTTAINEAGRHAARKLTETSAPRMPVMHRNEFAAHIDDTCTCPRTACGGVLVGPDQDPCPWHDTGEAADWPAKYHRVDDCPDSADPDETPCTGVGCAECRHTGCDRDYGDD